MGQAGESPHLAGLADRLAIQRTIMGADRTLLAQVRTSLSLISFGFTIYKVLEHFQKVENIRVVKDSSPRNIGFFLLVLGIVPLFISMVQRTRVSKELAGKRNLADPCMIEAAAILALGTVLLVTLVLNIDLI